MTCYVLVKLGLFASVLDSSESELKQPVVLLRVLSEVLRPEPKLIQPGPDLSPLPQRRLREPPVGLVAVLQKEGGQNRECPSVEAGQPPSDPVLLRGEQHEELVGIDLRDEGDLRLGRQRPTTQHPLLP